MARGEAREAGGGERLTRSADGCRIRGMTISDYVAKIDSARVYDVARVTSLDRARRLSDRLGANVFLTREDTQDVHTFKIRGRDLPMTPIHHLGLEFHDF